MEPGSISRMARITRHVAAFSLVSTTCSNPRNSSPISSTSVRGERPPRHDAARKHFARLSLDVVALETDRAAIADRTELAHESMKVIRPDIERLDEPATQALFDLADHLIVGAETAALATGANEPAAPAALDGRAALPGGRKTCSPGFTSNS